MQPLARSWNEQAAIGTAAGVWLDRIGERLGFPRPILTTAGDGPFFDFAAPVYAVAGDSLYTIQLTDAETESVGSIGWTPLAMAWANDALYAVHPTTRTIYTLNLETGAPTATTHMLSAAGAIQTASVDSDGLIWFVDANNELWTYDPDSGTIADNSTLTGAITSVHAMAWLGDTLYVFSGTEVYPFTATGGVGTKVGDTAAAATAATVWEGSIYTSDATGNINRLALSPFGETSEGDASLAIQSLAFSGPEGTGFEQGRFATALAGLQLRTGIGDEWYRAMLRARARALVSQGNIVDVWAAANLLFTGGAAINDGDHTNIWMINDAGHLFSVTLDPVTYDDIGDTGLGRGLSGLAWLDGTLYVYTDRLQSLNTETGAATAGASVSGISAFGFTSFDGDLWSTSRNGNLYRFPATGGAATSPGQFNITGRYEALVSHDGVLYAFSRQNPMAIYSVNTSNAALTLIGNLPVGVTGAASVGPYIYATNFSGSLYRITISPFTVTGPLTGSGGQTQVRAMASQFIPAVAYTDDRGAAYGSLAEEHASALLGLPAGVTLTVQRA